MRVLFTVCGRAGSKGFKNKNLKLLNNIPIIYYTLAVIQLYRERNEEDDVTVALNSDSEPLIEVARKQEVLRDIMIVDRKEELAGDKVAKVDVIRDTYKAVNEVFDVVIDLDITSPLRKLEDIENIIEVYKENKYEIVVSVVNARRSPYFNMVEKRGDTYKKICDSTFTARQETPKSYELNASIYAYQPEFLQEKIDDTILDHRCGISIMDDYLVLDIDSEEDFNMLEVLYPYYLEKDKGLLEVYDIANSM